MDWAWQLEHDGKKPMPGKTPYENEAALIKEVKADLEKGLAKTGGNYPRVLVIGALGRCGGGALDCCRAIGVPESNLVKWDLDETKKGGPFVSVRESDVSTNVSKPPSQPAQANKCPDLHKLHISIRRQHPQIRHQRLPPRRQETTIHRLRRLMYPLTLSYKEPTSIG